jgi:diguanylate cyclase
MLHLWTRLRVERNKKNTMDPVLEQLSHSFSSASSLEELTRPLLEMLESVTGLETSYLTTIDLKHDLQHVLYARNSSELQILEGLTVPWGDSLCKRSIDEKRPYTDDVAQCWGDSAAARELGIQTYVSTPIRVGSGDLYGTLCAASSTRHPLAEGTAHILSLFASFIARQVEREHLLDELHRVNAELRTLALTDALTGLLNRRAFIQELERMLAQARRAETCVLVGSIDLDGFKQINDVHGHDAGDCFLREMAVALSASLRAGDVLARFGGDEFVVAGVGPAPSDGEGESTKALARRLSCSTVGFYDIGDMEIDYPGASVGVVCVDPKKTDVAEALRRADSAMYETKLSRRNRKDR